ncbi:MAG: LL-diaminopimelate aminotransferase [Actinomycetia bacterium]|nr:LL-diaminopimelate aminotransferase [Actinomycetes bacterium]
MKAKRIKNLPKYHFAEINEIIKQKMESGQEVINLGIGDPDIPTPDYIIQSLQEEAKNPMNHKYPPYKGIKELREAITNWFEKRFGVTLNPEKEILPLIGSKEGLAHISWALIDPGDMALIANPCYPAHKTGVMLAGGSVYDLPLLEKNDFLVDFNNIQPEAAKKSKMMFICYPNNPTSAIADEDYFKKAVEYAKHYELIICHDNAYSEISYGEYKPISILEIDRKKELSIEFHSLSKTFSMAGWRIGFVVGNSNVIDSLYTLKTNIDSGIPGAIQRAAVVALNGTDEFTRNACKVYEKRIDMIIDILEECEIKVKKPKATLYIWAKVPESYSSDSFAMELLDKMGVFVTPGTAFGKYGEGYIRISVTQPDDLIKKASIKLRKFLKE